MKNIIKNKGFTLIEILLYMIVASVVLFAIMDFGIQISIVNKKTTNMQEIVTNIDFISTKITYSIQSATSIDNGNCIFNNDTGKLSLNVLTPEKSPIKFYLENSMIYIQEGENDAVKINSDSMKCTQLKFGKISQIKIPDQVSIDMKCEPLNADTANLRQTFSTHTSISLRQ